MCGENLFVELNLLDKTCLSVFFCYRNSFLIHIQVREAALHTTSGSVSSVTHSCLTLCDPMDSSMPGFPVHHQLPEFTQTHVHRVSKYHPTISFSVFPFSRLQSFPASVSLLMSQLFASGGQSIGVSPSTSVLPMNTQD